MSEFSQEAAQKALELCLEICAEKSLVEERIMGLNRLECNTPLKRLRRYEYFYGNFDPKFDYLLIDVDTGKY